MESSDFSKARAKIGTRKRSALGIVKWRYGMWGFADGVKHRDADSFQVFGVDGRCLNR